MSSVMKQMIILITVLLMTLPSFSQQAAGDPKLTEFWTPVPKIVTPGKTASDPPSDAVILFRETKDSVNWMRKDGKPFNWKAENNYFTVVARAGDVRTMQSFGDCQLHIEWRSPAEVKGEGQGRGNSGIFLMGRYELQVLDSYNSPTYSNGQAASIYKQHMPLKNASRPPGEWQVYDVIFTAPQFYEDSLIKSPARITVLYNGVLVQNNISLWGSTQYIGGARYEKHGIKEPLVLQDHGNPVSFRNIWIREL